MLSGGLAAVLCTVAASCSSPSLPAVRPEPPTVTEQRADSASEATTGSANDRAPVEDVKPDVDVEIDAGSTVREIDPRLLGTNVPAWLGPERLAAPWFRAAIADTGVAVLRMPGGSWSNSYDWLACELGDEDGCFWTWAARPSDFVDLLAATQTEGMWTVNVNETAQQAAAAVAFFNGAVDDETVIGVDRDGVDWGRVDDWARLRADGGSAEPAKITLWEVGNEVYGGNPDAGGEQCADFGWENVWTCDGAAYALGDDHHDGFLAIRDAMVAVDPEIEVGAVGVADQGSWANWGNEVIDATGRELDFYVVHQYGFGSSPKSPGDAAQRALQLWPDVIEAARAALDPMIPIAITEYNLVAVGNADADRTMTEVQNALFVADTIGQFAVHGVEIANQWNLANGTMESGTDYGLIDAETGAPFPQFEALAAWGRAGHRLVASSIADAERTDVRVYPTAKTDGSIVMILLHLDGSSEEVSIVIEGVDPNATVAIDTHWSSEATSTSFEVMDPVESQLEHGRMEIELPPWSLSVVEVSHG